MLAALKAIGEAITWFIRLLAAAVSFPFGVVGTLPPWRLRTGLRQWARAAGESSFGKMLNRFTAKNAAMFLVFILDALTIPVGAVASVTWRSPQMWTDFADEFDSDDDDDILDFDRRFVFWKGFVLFITDVPFGLMGMLNTVMVWHAPFFYTHLYREYRRVQADSSGPDFEWRSLVFLETLTGLAEILLLPFGLLIAVTGYRVLPTLESWRYVRDRRRSGDRATVVVQVADALMLRAQVLYHGANVLLDFFYLLMAVWTTALVVRVPALVADVREAARGSATWRPLIRDVRKAVLHNFLRSFRELAGTLAYLVLLPTGYRFLAALTSAREKSGSMADPACHTRLTSAVPEILKRGGVKVHIKGSKPKDLVFTTAKLYLRGEAFWDKVADSQGAGLTMVGKAFLPFDLCPTKAGKHVVLKTEDFKEGSTEFETTLHFELQSSKRCILRKVGEIGRDVFATIVVEFGSAHDGTLFDVCSTLGNFVDCSEEGRSLPVQPASANTLCISTQSSAELRKPPVEGPLFCDVMTAPALLQLVYFLGDLCALVLFVLLHLFPWRAWSLYHSYFATRAATAARRTLRTVDELGRTLRAPRSCPHALLRRMNGTLDAQVKQGLLHVPSVASGFAPPGRFSYNNQRSKIGNRRRRMYVAHNPLKPFTPPPPPPHHFLLLDTGTSATARSGTSKRTQTTPTTFSPSTSILQSSPAAWTARNPSFRAACADSSVRCTRRTRRTAPSASTSGAAPTSWAAQTLLRRGVWATDASGGRGRRRATFTSRRCASGCRPCASATSLSTANATSPTAPATRPPRRRRTPPPLLPTPTPTPTAPARRSSSQTANIAARWQRRWRH